VTIHVNRQLLLGRIGPRGVRLTYNSNGMPLCSLTLEIDKPGKQGDVYTSYHTVEITGRYAEQCAAELEAQARLHTDDTWNKEEREALWQRLEAIDIAREELQRSIPKLREAVDAAKQQEHHARHRSRKQTIEAHLAQHQALVRQINEGLARVLADYARYSALGLIVDEERATFDKEGRDLCLMDVVNVPDEALSPHLVHARFLRASREGRQE
jgi:hypothetical protein